MQPALHCVSCPWLKLHPTFGLIGSVNDNNCVKLNHVSRITQQSYQQTDSECAGQQIYTCQASRDCWGSTVCLTTSSAASFHFARHRASAATCRQRKGGMFQPMLVCSGLVILPPQSLPSLKSLIKAPAEPVMSDPDLLPTCSLPQTCAWPLVVARCRINAGARDCISCSFSSCSLPVSVPSLLPLTAERRTSSCSKMWATAWAAALSAGPSAPSSPSMLLLSTSAAAVTAIKAACNSTPLCPHCYSGDKTSAHC